MPKGKSICIKLYLPQEDFAEIAADAEKVSIRHKGLLLFTQKPHGFANEKLANTDGIAKFFKHTWKYWKETEHKRLEELAKLSRDEQEIAERKKKLVGI